MALSLPLQLPAATLAVRDRKFSLEPANIYAPTWGGLNQTASVGRSAWVMRYDLRPLEEADAFEVLALLRALREGARTFRAVDPLRRFAINYRDGYGGMTKAGGGAFSGDAFLSEVGGTLDSVTLGGLPASFVLKKGDRLSFAFSTTRQALHEVTEAATSDGSGVATIGVEPPLIPGYATGAGVAVALADPWCKATIVKGSVTEQWMPNRRCAISFAGRQDIR